MNCSAAGLLPGTLTVVVGATGIGKTQLGLQFAARRASRKKSDRGILFDMTSRGDPQSHGDYAERMFDWRLESVDPELAPQLDDAFFAADRRHGDYLNIFRNAGRRVTRRDLTFEEYQEWQAELARKLNTAIAFFYGNFVQGVPPRGDRRHRTARPQERLDSTRAVRVRLSSDPAQGIRSGSPAICSASTIAARRTEIAAAQVRPDEDRLRCCSTRRAETMLDPLLERPLDEGDLLANANTIIYLGKTRTPDGKLEPRVARRQTSRQRLQRRHRAVRDRRPRGLRLA